MYAEIITIGDEILIGQIVDSNSAWMAQKLNEIGVDVRQITSISDQIDAITESLSKASERADIILITGGLGPTNDDLTREALAKYFNSGMHIDQKVLAHVTNIFSRSNKPLLAVNSKQAEVLDIAEVLFNKVGTAPGMYMKSQGKHIFVMPGVPFEMKYLMENEVIPKIRTFSSSEVIVHRSILIGGLGESFLALEIEDIEKRLPSTIKLAYLPSFGEVRLRLSAKGTDKDDLCQKVEFFINLIKERLPDNWFAEGDSTLEEALLNYLIDHNLRLSTAESCTGGQIAHLLTGVAGSSRAYEGGVVAYSNSIKEKLLGVPKEVINKYGPVSEQVVAAMTEGVKRQLNTDYSISTTGIAGPNGGTVENPVGTVWIGITGKTKTITQCYNFGSMRHSTIERASKTALFLLFKLLYEENR